MAVALLEAESVDSLGWKEDLATLASRAAVELDDRILQRANTLPSVRRLSEILASSVAEVHDAASPSSSLNPSTAVLLRRAIPGGHELNSLEELLEEARKLTGRINNLVENERPEPAALEQLREFCLELSRKALAMRRSPLERPGHPFRR